MAETGTGGYREVIEWVQNQIASGAFREGDRMPTEKALAEQFGLSRQTIRHATGTLVEQKVLTRIQGSGTYVGCIGKPRRTKRTMRIAVISTFYESYIFPPILKGIERTLSDAGYAMQVSFTDNQVARERQILEQIHCIRRSQTAAFRSSFSTPPIQTFPSPACGWTTSPWGERRCGS